MISFYKINKLVLEDLRIFQNISNVPKLCSRISQKIPDGSRMFQMGFSMFENVLERL